MLNKRPSYFIRSTINPDKYVIDYDINDLVKKHTQPKDWLNHLHNDLLKFWDCSDAITMEYSLFPTFRGNHGQVLNPDGKDLPPEIIEAIKDPETKDLIDLERNYIKMHSRQTYAYGIAYHITGEEKYLQLCKKGAYSMIQNAKDDSHGLFTNQNRISGTWGDSQKERNSQELAYGLLGIGMYYYLTHDPYALHTILECKEYIFRNYFSRGKGYFTWLPSDIASKAVDISAQLDQLYAYMLLVTPALPEPYQTQWKSDLKMIVNILIKRFYSERYGFFWGNESSEKNHSFGNSHTDFGHSVKTFWLIYQIGCYLDETSFINFARPNIDAVLADAYVAPDRNTPGSWGRRYNKDGSFDNTKEWWQLAELDQACGILSLNDPSYLAYLNETYKYWFQFMIDKEYGEIWHMVDGDTNEPILKYPKIHQWKACHHSFEHCLFGYLISSQIKNSDFILYYAFTDKSEVNYNRVRPYFFDAYIKKTDMEYFHQIDDDTNKIKVKFNSLH